MDIRKWNSILLTSIIIAVSLDLISTVIALWLGLQEVNQCTLFFMGIFGQFPGLFIANAFKLTVFLLGYKMLLRQSKKMQHNFPLWVFLVVMLFVYYVTLNVVLHNFTILYRTLMG